MHIHSLNNYCHSHILEDGEASLATEKKIRWVTILTLVTMVGEIIAGWLFGSLALLADGWHMASHSLAFFIALFSYAYARSRANDPRFSFGTGKVDALGGFTSAIILGGIALAMVAEAVSRFFNPQDISYSEAMGVAALGLMVNLASAWLLAPEEHHHEHEHDHDHHREPGHTMKATYIHVITDALTSLGAIIALGAGMLWGMNWLDPLIGLVGALVIGVWAFRLLQNSGRVLLDQTQSPELSEQIRQLIENDADNRITDLHVWEFHPRGRAVIISLVTHYPRPPEHYKALLGDIAGLAHVTVEVHHHQGPPCVPV